MPTALIAAATTIMIVVLSTFDTYARNVCSILGSASPGRLGGIGSIAGETHAVRRSRTYRAGTFSQTRVTTLIFPSLA